MYLFPHPSVGAVTPTTRVLLLQSLERRCGETPDSVWLEECGSCSKSVPETAGFARRCCAAGQTCTPFLLVPRCASDVSRPAGFAGSMEYEVRCWGGKYGIFSPSLPRSAWSGERAPGHL